MGSYCTVAKFVKDHSLELKLFTHYLRQMPTKVIISIITLRLQDNDHIIHLKYVVREIKIDHGIQILYNKVWRAKEYVYNLIYRDPLHSFKLLLFYFYILE